ncbi:hypothetical protein RYX56_01155 [Alkalihalophilus lindianensis]|uniref:Uncharacterized protein n=1 Tax=Alkalihalophilus lindianensis TaxID=1630542 RepID=A0ABU3X523_9BACI|nr:hypothetical protein [Alkalihalophilus lindianensis]MDV2682974.1 hypothetical protein [Alkalihalophilus lindianensis]
MVVFILFLIFMFILIVQFGMSLFAALFGNRVISFMEFTYTTNPETGYDRFMNGVFYALYGVPHFFYKKFMIKHSYGKARVLFFIWMLGFFIVFCILAGTASILAERYSYFL